MKGADGSTNVDTLLWKQHSSCPKLTQVHQKAEELCLRCALRDPPRHSGMPHHLSRSTTNGQGTIRESHHIQGPRKTRAPCPKISGLAHAQAATRAKMLTDGQQEAGQEAFGPRAGNLALSPPPPITADEFRREVDLVVVGHYSVQGPFLVLLWRENAPRSTGHACNQERKLRSKG